MLNRNDILETINMIDQQHLDIRTITMGISLLSCADPDPKAACHTDDAQTGIEQINIILNSYANMLFVDPEGIRFSLDAEVALYSVGKNAHVINRPPERYEAYKGPLSQAVRRGLADGTVDPNANIKQLYYNAYDSILGMMQRLTVGVPSVSELDAHERLESMCAMFTREFAAKK